MAEILRELQAWLCLAIAGGAIAAALWFLVIPTRRILPPQRHRATGWTGLEVFLVFFLGYQGIVLFVDPALVDSGFFQRLYGPEFPLNARLTEADPGRQLAAARRMLWTATVAFPFQLGLIALILRARGLTHLYQLGLTSHRLADQIVTGYVFWLVLALPVLGFDWLVNLGYENLLHVAPARHPLDLVLEQHAGEAEWGLVAFLVIVAAPILEELVFRGVIQGWAMRHSWGGTVVMSAALLAAVLAYALTSRTEEGGDATISVGSNLERLAPILFVLVLVPGYLLAERLAWRWLPEPHVAPAIYSTALLFAVYHAPVWPSPIPLFLLALGLGYLAYRTQSLLGPMLVHALFNGVSALSVLFGPR